MHDKKEGIGMSVIVDFSIFPVGKGESVSKEVARAAALIRQRGLPHTMGPMGTSVEGEWEEVMDLVRDCFYEMKKECGRIYMTIKVDYRKGKEGRLTGKVKSLKEKMKE
jgi:uncharacterized protein (TIGR00106 family)